MIWSIQQILLNKNWGPDNIEDTWFFFLKSSAWPWQWNMVLPSFKIHVPNHKYTGQYRIGGSAVMIDLNLLSGVSLMQSIDLLTPYLLLSGTKIFCAESSWCTLQYRLTQDIPWCWPLRINILTLSSIERLAANTAYEETAAGGSAEGSLFSGD